MKTFQKDGNLIGKSNSESQSDQPCQQNGSIQASSEAGQPEQIFQEDGSQEEGSKKDGNLIGKSDSEQPSKPYLQDGSIHATRGWPTRADLPEEWKSR